MPRYLFRIANKEKYKPEQISEVIAKYEKLSQKFGVSLKNFRISELAIEFDLFAKNEEVVKSVVSELGPLLTERDLNDESPVLGKQAIVHSIIELFNAQRYWECHETMEVIWRTETNRLEKELQQGVILAASALVHAQKNENSVCLGMITRSIAMMERWKEERYYGMPIGSLKKFLKKTVETREISFPKI